MKERNNYIDLVKGVCMIMIIITHFEISYQERLDMWFPFTVSMAVPILMMISGFMSSRSIERANYSTIEEVYTAKYIVKKAIRLTSPFLMAYLIEQGILAYDYLYVRGTELPDTPLHYLLVGGRGPGSYYYPIMMQFIFVFPVIYWIVSKLNLKGLWLCFGINFFYEIFKYEYGMGPDYYRLSLLRYVFAIAVGVYAAKNKDQVHKIWYWVITLLGCYYIYRTSYLKIIPDAFSMWYRTSMFTCLWVAPIMYVTLRASEKIHIPKIEPLCLLGKASFNIFLCQMVYYGTFLDNKIYELFPDRLTSLLLNIVICTVGGCIFYYLEQPITKRIAKAAGNYLDRKKATVPKTADEK